MLGVTTGTLALAAAAGILAFGRIGQLRGPTVHLLVATDEARGVIQGTEVWLAGEKVGVVRGTKLRAYTVDTSQRVLVDLDVRRDDAVRIRRDSRAQIRPGSSMLGSPVVFFDGGTADSPPVKSGDTIVADPQSALDVTRGKFAEFEQQIPEIRADIDTLKATFFSPNGTLGSAAREGDVQAAQELRILTHRLNQRRVKVEGSLALIGRGELMKFTRSILVTSDSLVTLATGRAGAMNRLRSDTTFANTIDSTRAQLAAVRALLATPVGTAGRVQVDSAILRQLDSTDIVLRHLESDAAKYPHRYSPW
jgi:hypothetical protein